MTKEKFLLSILYVAFLLMGQTKGFCQTSCTADQWQTVVASTEDDYADFPCDTVITRTCGHSIIVTAEAGGTGRGRVEGGGEYYEGDTATLTVLPWTLWGFLRWADGDTTNPRRVVVTQDTTLTAIFVSREAIEAAPEGDAGFSLMPNPAWGSVSCVLHDAELAGGTLTVAGALGQDVLAEGRRATNTAGRTAHSQPATRSLLHHTHHPQLYSHAEIAG